LLKKISKAPLKPQQRLIILRTHLVPALLHGLIFGRVTKAKLVTMDRAIRAEVRQWLHLPKDTALGYFHAPISEGGLGISSLSTLIPIYRKERLSKLERSPWPIARACLGLDLFANQMHWCDQVSGRVRTTTAAKRHFTRLLHHSVDGKELVKSKDSSLSTDWVVANSAGIPGRDYINYHRVRSGSLPSKVRITRGVRRQSVDVGCRAGCLADETAAHIVQNCWRSHGGRVHRHDAVVAMAARALVDRGWDVEREYLYTIPCVASDPQELGGGPKGQNPVTDRQKGQVLSKRLKPDIVAVREGEVVVIDAQIVSGANDLSRTHQDKVRKYDVGELKKAIRNRKSLPDDASVKVRALTVTWKGVWCSRSAVEMNTLFSKNTLRGITTRVLWGSQKNFERFMASTSVRRRVGVG
jgi:hypothetical protein